MSEEEKPTLILNGEKTIRIPTQADIEQQEKEQAALKAKMGAEKYKEHCRMEYKMKKYGKNSGINITETFFNGRNNNSSQ